jgi:hypothetical protein
LAVRAGEGGAALEIGAEYAVLDGWDMENANLVLSPNNGWEETVFKPRDAAEITIDGYRCLVPITGSIDVNNLPGGAAVIKGAWNHEHCAVCMQCICEVCGPEAWISKEGVWVCKKCHEEYICPRSIEFHF